jgi:predicted DCC family thiol-disulfide oxidoreductase YuxK
MAAELAELTVLFDGDCELCAGLARRLRRWDRAHRLELLPLRAPEVATRFPQLRRTELERELHAVEPDGTVHAGVEALRRIGRLVPRLWVLLPLLRLPLGWHRLYAAIASRRRALDPRSACDSCRGT